VSLTTCQDSAFEVVKGMKPGETLFLTGQAGTGKSYLLEQMQAELPGCVTVASTGLAAVRVNGVTAHSLFGLNIGIYEPYAAPFRVTKQNKEVIEDSEYLLIDEVSMLRSDTLDAISDCCKWIRDNRERFGGLKVVMIGDILQLPPIVGRDEVEQFDLLYRSPWFFDAMCLTSDLQVVELTSVMRQKDNSFINALNATRIGRSHGLELLNSRVAQKPDNSIELVTRNDIAERRNMIELDKLRTKANWYYGTLTGNFKESECPVPMTMSFKPGARVVMMKNSRSYRNGEMGVVESCGDHTVAVRLDSGTSVTVSGDSWEKATYSRNTEGKLTRDVVGTYSQLPLRLAYAISVHKSQGQTYENVHLNIAGKCFAPGMAYVALSRCKTLDGMTLEKQLTSKDIFADKRVIEFYDNANWVGDSK